MSTVDPKLLKRTYRRNGVDGREWVLRASGHLGTRQRDVALVVSERKQGSNPLIDPHAVTLSIVGAESQITLDVDQLWRLLNEVDGRIAE